MWAAELRALIGLIDAIAKNETQVALFTMRKRLASELEAVIEPARKAVRSKKARLEAKREAGD